MQTTTDRFNRPWIFIPDDEARDLKAWARGTWTEIAGVGDGYSATARPGSKHHDLLNDLANADSDGCSFIAGESFVPLGDDQDYGLLVSTCGVRSDHRGGWMIAG